MKYKRFAMFILLLSFVISTSVKADICAPYWVKDSIVCQNDDQYVLSYHDLNDCNTTLSLPNNNGTLQSCNFCSPDIQWQYSPCIGQKTNLSYIDLNYASCCAVTSIPDDCMVDFSPYNVQTEETCFYDNLSNQLGNLSCQREPNMGVNDKEYCVAYIPTEFLNESFKCIAFILDGKTGEVIQTTPEYRETQQTFINLFPDADTRQYFTPANSIVNFYYTGKNLNPEKTYILNIQCSSTYRVLKSEMTMQIAYEDMSFVFFRIRWLMGNAPYIIAGTIMLVIILGIAFLWVRK